MYARLWWKDARQFWPIWIFLVLAATIVQIMAFVFSGPDAKNFTFGMLGLWAMGWTALYALAVGAASFAGERETGTLRLLDIIPISRSRVWAGKVSFGVVTTLAMALILLIVAFLGAASSPANVASALDTGLYPPLTSSMRIGTLFIATFEALGWGFLCSAILSSAIAAAITAIVFTVLGWSVAMGGLDYFFYQDSLVPGYLLLLANLVIAVLTTLLSLVVFARGWQFGGVSIGFRSPFILRSPIEFRAPLEGTTLLTAVPPTAPDFSAIGSAIRGAGSSTVFIPGKRSRLAEARALVWQTVRQGRGIWLLLAFVSVVLPWTIVGMVDPAWLLIVNSAVALTAGISVFGVEHRRNTQRFLVHHGARPGLVWIIKLSVWVAGLALLWGGIYLYVTVSLNLSQNTTGQISWTWRHRPVETLLMLGLAWGGFFAVAQLFGMAIRRGITAWVLGLVAALLVVGPAGFLVGAQILQPWYAVLIVPAFLLISWLWSGDWLFDRPAPARWVRLGLISSAIATVLFGGFIAERAWGVPDSPLISTPHVWATLANLATDSDRDAAPLYRDAARLYRNMANSIVMGADGRTGGTIRMQVPPTGTDPVNLEQVRTQTLSAIHKAASRPDCRFQDPTTLSLHASLDIPPMDDLAYLVSEQYRRMLASGDLASAWKQVMVLFQMARHTSEVAILGPSLTALKIEESAFGLAREWALDPRQSPERLHEAIIAYPNWPARISRDQVVQGEARWLERSIAQINDDDILELQRPSFRKDYAPSVWAALWARLLTPAWERERARRVGRLVFTELLRLSNLAPSQWSADQDIYTQEQSSSPLASRLFHSWTTLQYLKNDTDKLVERSALVQVMAIREWQLRHEGQFPATLKDLVPTVLPELPVDPYSGKSYQYLGWTPGDGNPWDWPAGTRIIYSVGPDRTDDHGRVPSYVADKGDMVFSIPAIAPKAKVSADGVQRLNNPAADKPLGGSLTP